MSTITHVGVTHPLENPAGVSWNEARVRVLIDECKAWRRYFAVMRDSKVGDKRRKQVVAEVLRAVTATDVMGLVATKDDAP